MTEDEERAEIRARLGEYRSAVPQNVLDILDGMGISLDDVLKMSTPSFDALNCALYDADVDSASRKRLIRFKIESLTNGELNDFIYSGRNLYDEQEEDDDF